MTHQMEENQKMGEKFCVKKSFWAQQQVGSNEEQIQVSPGEELTLMETEVTEKGTILIFQKADGTVLKTSAFKDPDSFFTSIFRETTSKQDSTSKESFTLKEILYIAKKQRIIALPLLIFFLIGSLVAIFGLDLFPLYYLIKLILIPYVYLWARSLKKKRPYIWAICYLLPYILFDLIGLIVITKLSRASSEVIRSSGFKVGFMGANIKEIEDAINKASNEDNFNF